MIDGTALITGGDQPLGAAIAERLSETTDDIVLGGADGGNLTETVDRIDSEGITQLRTDPRDEFDLERLAETAAKRRAESLGLVIPAARISHSDSDQPITDISYAAFDDELRTNLRGVFSTIREATPHCGDSTKILVPVTESQATSMTFAAGEAAIERLVKELSATTPLSIAAVDIGATIEDGELDPDRAAASVIAALTKAPSEFDGRTFGSAD